MNANEAFYGAAAQVARDTKALAERLDVPWRRAREIELYARDRAADCEWGDVDADDIDDMSALDVVLLVAHRYGKAAL